MRFDLPTDAACAYVRQRISEAGGFSALLLDRPLREFFSLAGEKATTEQLLAFHSGHDWGNLDSNKELAKSAELISSDWWAIYHNVWSEESFLHADERSPSDTFLFAGSYCHYGRTREIPFSAWYERKIGFRMVIVLVAIDPLPLISASGEISEPAARELVETAVAIFVDAYDGVSWVGASIA